MNSQKGTCYKGKGGVWLGRYRVQGPMACASGGRLAYVGSFGGLVASKKRCFSQIESTLGIRVTWEEDKGCFGNFERLIAIKGNEGNKREVHDTERDGRTLKGPPALKLLERLPVCIPNTRKMKGGFNFLGGWKYCGTRVGAEGRTRNNGRARYKIGKTDCKKLLKFKGAY